MGGIIRDCTHASPFIELEPLIPLESTGNRASQLSQPPLRGASSYKKPWRHQGWRFGLTLTASTVTFVLVVNITLVTTAACIFKPTEGIVTLHVGDCSFINKWNVGIHLLINGLSSALLGASNYAMQCIMSPTRSECDAAHSRGDWLDIGVSGIRNVRRISGQRRFLWALLLTTSIPIHLLYNSAVFKTLDTNEYRYALLADHLVNAPALDNSQLTNSNRGVEVSRMQYLEAPDKYEHLDAETCISIYGRPFLSGYSNVLLITTDIGYDYTTMEQNVQYWDTVRLNHDSSSSISFANDLWACNGLHFRNQKTETAWKHRDSNNQYCSGSDFNLAANWTLSNFTIDHCLARKTTEHCKLQFSPYIMVPVILCNFIKAVSMFWALINARETTFVTVGDALASWLDNPDEFSKGRCLMSKDDIDESWATPEPTPFKRKSDRDGYWCGAVSLKRWTVTILSCYSILALAFILLPISSVKLDFGSFDPQLIISVGRSQTTSSALIGCVLLANTPQLLLSISYVLYNGLFTSMHLAHEYSGYALERKPLRVTDPTGDQRSTYWLQLPLRYGIPLLVASSVLHWLVSQSIFLARVAVWRNGGGESLETATGEIDSEDWTASVVGYSGLPLLCVVALGVSMLLAAMALAFKKLPSRVPIAGSCSLAIAAAAHRPESDVGASVLPVRWGVVADQGAVRHVCFTSQEVTEPEEGTSYA